MSQDRRPLLCSAPHRFFAALKTWARRIAAGGAGAVAAQSALVATIAVTAAAVVIGVVVVVCSSDPSPPVHVAEPVAASPEVRDSPASCDKDTPDGDTDGYFTDDSTDPSHAIPVAVPVAASPYGRGRTRTERAHLPQRRDSSIHSNASDEEKAKKRTIVLKNGSGYLVSYYVLREDNMTTKKVEMETEKKILASVNLSTTDPGVQLGARGAKVKTVVLENDPTFLLHDKKILPSCSPGMKDCDVMGTTIKYPKDCRNLRVIGLFEDEGQWKQFKNQVYRAGKKKTCQVITAMDDQIEGHLSG